MLSEPKIHEEVAQSLNEGGFPRPKAEDLYVGPLEC
jgi:hypothetical protein